MVATAQERTKAVLRASFESNAVWRSVNAVQNAVIWSSILLKATMTAKIDPFVVLVGFLGPAGLTFSKLSYIFAYTSIQDS